VKASFPTLKGGKEAFTDTAIAAFTPGAPAVTPAVREGPLPSAQPKKPDLHTFPRSVKASLRDPGSLKEAFTDLEVVPVHQRLPR